MGRVGENGIGKTDYRSKRIVHVFLILAVVDTVGVATVVLQILPRLDKLEVSPVLAGFLSAFYGIVQLFSSPFMGNISDKYPKKQLLIVCILVSAASYYLLSFPSLITFAISRFLAGVFKHTNLLSMATITDLLPPEEKGKYFGLFGAGVGVGFIFGPVIGGCLAEREDGFSYMCYFASILFLCNAVMIWLLTPAIEPLGKKEDKKEAPRSENSGILGILENLGVESCWDVLVLQALAEVAMIANFSGFHLNMESDYSMSPMHVGYTLCIASLASTVAIMLAEKLQSYLGGGAIRYMAYMNFISYISFAIPLNLPLFYIMLVLNGIANGAFRSWWPTIATSRSPPHRSGAVVGGVNTVAAVGIILGPILGGLFIEVLGSPKGSVLLASLTSFVLLLCTRWFPRPSPKSNVD